MGLAVWSIFEKLVVFLLIPVLAGYTVTESTPAAGISSGPLPAFGDLPPEIIIDGDERLSYAAFSDSGDENGNIYTARLYRNEQGETVLEVNRRDTAWDELVRSVYLADNDALTRLEEIAGNAGFSYWQQSEHCFMEVCDASQPYLYLYYTDDDGSKRNTEINGYTVFDDHELRAYREAIKLIKKWEREENLIERQNAENGR